jgi:class 3 adenylate cyclase
VEAIVDVYLRSFIAEDKERAIRRSFAKFVPEDIIDTLVRRENTAQQMVGEKRTVAILFSDIRSFTTITELNRAEDLVAFLNRYFAVMGEIIEKHGGTIDKFIGDAILAVFGAPRSYPDNAHRAVKAAMEMVESLDSIPRENIQLPDGVFATGIGVHEGSAIVGNIGSKNKFDYTVIGDAVNLASRLEGLTKHYKQKIIVSDSVYDRLKTEVLFRPLDFVKVKGKNESTMIYSIEMDLESSLVGDTLDCFVRGLKLYRMRNWTGALEQFRKVLEERPNDSVTFVFIDRCLELMEKPPDESWDGSVSLDFK